jgi:tetratricopeptide (TPR) repeat protein
MSLLNDALRKKRSERQSTGEPLPPVLMKLGSRSKRKRRWMVVSGSMALLVAGAVAWWYGAAFETASSPAAADHSAIAVQAHADDSVDRPAGGNTMVTPVAGPSALPAQSAVAGEAVAKPQADAQRPHSLPEINSARASRHSPAISAELPKVRTVAKPAVKKTIDHASRQPLERHAHHTASAAPATDPTNENHRLQIERLYQKARQYHRRDRLDQAIALYQEVLKEDPGHAKARFNLVAAYLQIEAYTKAYPMAAELYLKEPDNQQVMLNLAIAQIGCGRIQEALTLLGKAAGRSDAALFEIAFHKAVAYRHLNRMQDALTWYKRAEAMRPTDPSLLFNLAVAYDQRQQYAEAVDYYLKYIEYDKQPDPLKTKKIRGRVRILQAYHAHEKFKE